MRKRRSIGEVPKDARAEVTDFTDIPDGGDWVLCIRHAAVSSTTATPWLNLKLIREKRVVGRCNYWLAYNLSTEALASNRDMWHIGRRTDIKGTQLLSDVAMACAEWVAENPEMVKVQPSEVSQPAPSEALDFADLLK